MDYAQRVFNKSLRELSFDDIVNYFQQPREESETLEFKSGQGDFEGTFVNNIIRTISAFLNSSGGLLIWGAPKDSTVEKGKSKICTGDLSPLTIFKDKDHLVNRISSAISYMPTGIRIERLEKDGQYIYIFEVDESPSKPHQYNGIYYIRLDGQSKPAPHYVVDALFKQIKFANLEGSVSFDKISHKEEKLLIDFEAFVRNRSKFIIEKSLSLSVHTSLGFFENNKKKILTVERTSSLHYGPEASFTNQLVIELENLKNGNTMCDFILFFAGESSLAKVSKYKLNLKPYTNPANMPDGNNDSFIQDVQENVLFD